MSIVAASSGEIVPEGRIAVIRFLLTIEKLMRNRNHLI